MSIDDKRAVSLFFWWLHDEVRIRREPTPFATLLQPCTCHPSKRGKR